MKEKFIRKGAVRVGKGFTLFIWNGDMSHVFKILKSLGDLNVLIDGITGTAKHKIKKQKGEFLPPLLAS